MSPFASFALNARSVLVPVSSMPPEAARHAFSRARALAAARQAAGLSIEDAAGVLMLTPLEYRRLEQGLAGYAIPEAWDNAIAGLSASR